MNTDEKARWDERYSTGDYRPRSQPSAIVDRAIEYGASGRALVLACGTGRNALRLSEAGLEVTAVDISSVAIDMARHEARSRGLKVDWRVGDVAEFDLSEGKYDLITMIRYVNRSIWPVLADALATDGWLVMEQHLRTYREVIGPSADYRVDTGELLVAFSGMRIIEYFELIEPSERSEGLAASARMLACKGDPGW